MLYNVCLHDWSDNKQKNIQAMWKLYASKKVCFLMSRAYQISALFYAQFVICQDGEESKVKVTCTNKKVEACSSVKTYTGYANSNPHIIVLL